MLVISGSQDPQLSNNLFIKGGLVVPPFQIQTVILSYGKVSFLVLFQGSYHCLQWSGPSLYIPCAQHGAVNCSQTHPEMSGLLPSCAAPAASFSKIWCVKSKPLGHLFQLILLIKSKLYVEVIICWLQRLTFFTSLFFTHSIILSNMHKTEEKQSIRQECQVIQM